MPKKGGKRVRLDVEDIDTDDDVYRDDD